MKYTISLFNRKTKLVFDYIDIETDENLFRMKSRDAGEFCRDFANTPYDGVETYIIEANGKRRKLKYR